MKRALALTIVVVTGLAAARQNTMDAGDLVRLAEAYRIAAAIQRKVWLGWDAAPFSTLLVTSDREFLVRHPKAPPGFAPAEYSSILDTEVLSRPRQFSPGLLATFPAFGPPPTIVVGRSDATKKSSTAWVLTVLHEHFHQYQMADPAYFAAVDELGLSGGDTTGTWMLNYPFPYESPDVARAFAEVSSDLAGQITAPSRAGRQRFWQSYGKLLAGLRESDRRYLSFQTWQEGVARYVELRAAQLAAMSYTPTSRFQALPDFQPFSAVSVALREQMLSELRNADLTRLRRVSFYSFGAGLALLLDQDGDRWKDQYLSHKFALELLNHHL